MTLVATQVKRRRGTTAENDAFTGAEGEIVVDTERHELRVHDGSTVGGYRIPTKDYGYSKTESDNLLSNKADTGLSNITSAGKAVCANMAMPSNRYVALTLGAAGTTYVAPADGYVFLEGNTTGVGYILLGGSNCDTTSSSHANSGSYISATIPVRKGMAYGVWYQNLTAGRFRFVYANGAQ